MAFIEIDAVDRAIRKLRDTEAELVKAAKKVAETQQNIASIQHMLSQKRESAVQNAGSGGGDSNESSLTAIRHLQAILDANQIALADQQRALARASHDRDEAQGRAGKLLNEIEVSIGKVEGNIARLRAQTGKPADWLRTVLATEQRELQKLRQLRSRLIEALGKNLAEQSPQIAGAQTAAAGVRTPARQTRTSSGSYFGSSGLHARSSAFGIDQQLAADPFQYVPERADGDRGQSKQRLEPLADFGKFIDRVLDGLMHFLR